MASNTVVPIPVSAASGMLNAYTTSLAIYEAATRTFFFRSSVPIDKVAIYGSNDGTTVSTGILVSMGANSAPVSINDRCRFYVAIFTGSGTRTCSVSLGPLAAGGGGSGGNHLNMVALGNFAAGGSIGTAPNTVDQFNGATIAQTTSGQTLTLPTPTDPSASTQFVVENIGSNLFLMEGVNVLASSSMIYFWNGSAWTPSGVGTSSPASDTVIGDNSGGSATLIYAGSAGMQLIIDDASFDVQTGVGPILIGADLTDKTIDVGSVTGASTMTLRAGSGGASLDASTGNIGIGSALATDKRVTIGSLTGSSPTVMQSGTTGVTVQPVATGPVMIISGTTGLASLDSGSTGPVFVGAGAAVKATTVGSVTGASATALRAGTAALTLVRNGVTWSWPNADATLANARAALMSDGAGNLSFGNSIQSGTTSLAAGASAAIPANIAVGSQIWVQATDVTPGAGNLTIDYRPLAADRVNGTPGSFKVTAVLAAGTINVLDVSAGIRWFVLNP